MDDDSSALMQNRRNVTSCAKSVRGHRSDTRFARCHTLAAAVAALSGLGVATLIRQRLIHLRSKKWLDWKVTELSENRGARGWRLYVFSR